VRGTRRWTDAAGHAWPVTGLECSVCGLPLDPVLADAGTHPNCDLEEEM